MRAERTDESDDGREVLESSGVQPIGCVLHLGQRSHGEEGRGRLRPASLSRAVQDRGSARVMAAARTWWQHPGLVSLRRSNAVSSLR
ncbi:hypothetical protein SFUMM280S_03341 [Streptomyces fumanus]